MKEDVFQHIARLVSERPAMKEVLEAYEELLSIAAKVQPQCIHPAPAQLANTENKLPLFSRKELPVDMDTATTLLNLFLQRLSTSKRKDGQGISKALSMSKNSPQWLQKLLHAALLEDTERLEAMGKETELDPETLRFLALTALKPSLECLRESLAPVVASVPWNRGPCPICGSEANMAYLDSTGKRWLHCGLCGHEYGFPRIECPFCSNTNHDSLGYFEDAEKPGIRVDFCKNCSRYMKTLDARLLEVTAPLDIENLASLHLDVLAVQNGFH